MKTKINIEVLCELCHYLKKDQIELLLKNLPIEDKKYILSFVEEFNLN
tara:strand:+ start:2003 stop:2146 length:144 start_codon:yes stop_codon:yes gene_type:complete